MYNLYGFFGENIYRMSRKTNVETKVVEPFKSSTYVRENTVDRSITTCVKLNTMDLYKEEPNEAIYEKLLDFIKKSKLTGINTLYYSLKIALNYQITDPNGGIIDGGIRYVQVDADEVNLLLDPDPLTNTLSYRRAEYLRKKFAISRICGAKYGVMDTTPKYVDFTINGITIYANFTDMGSAYYIQNLGPSAQDTTFAYGSGTVNSIIAHSVVLFDTADFGITIPSQRLACVPNTIYVDVETILNNFCYVADDTEIWRIIEMNGGATSNAPSDFNVPAGGLSPFDPVINRPPCPGNRPMPPVHPGHRPGVKPPCHPNCPIPIIPKPPVAPIVPSPGVDTEGTIVPDPDYNQDHGDMNEEWCHAAVYDDPSIKFLVVADETADTEFDATSMVKISDVLPYVTDVKIGDYVKKNLVMYY